MSSATSVYHFTGKKHINIYIYNMLLCILKIQGADIVKVSMHLPKVALLDRCEKIEYSEFSSFK